MRISHEHKLIFFSTPKCGSHTGWEIMEKYFNAKRTGTIHLGVVPEKYRNYLAFTFVRNPYERAIAIWNSLLEFPKTDNDERGYRRQFMSYIGSDTFEDFCEWLASTGGVTDRARITWPQWKIHALSNIKNINYFKLEELQENLKPFLYLNTGVSIGTFPHNLKRKHPTWKEIQTPKLKQLINKWAGKDFDRYGYIKY